MYAHMHRHAPVHVLGLVVALVPPRREVARVVQGLRRAGDVALLRVLLRGLLRGSDPGGDGREVRGSELLMVRREDPIILHDAETDRSASERALANEENGRYAPGPPDYNPGCSHRSNSACRW